MVTYVELEVVGSSRTIHVAEQDLGEVVEIAGKRYVTINEDEKACEILLEEVSKGELEAAQLYALFTAMILEPLLDGEQLPNRSQVMAEMGCTQERAMWLRSEAIRRGQAWEDGRRRTFRRRLDQ